MRILQEPFSTLRLLVVPPGDDPRSEPLSEHAGILIQRGKVMPTWDGVSGTSHTVRRLITSTQNDFTASELRALALKMTGSPSQEDLSEASLSRIAATRKEAFRLLQADRLAESGSVPEELPGPD